jgi:hypothetical protein
MQPEPLRPLFRLIRDGSQALTFVHRMQVIADAPVNSRFSAARADSVASGASVSCVPTLPRLSCACSAPTFTCYCGDSLSGLLLWIRRLRSCRRQAPPPIKEEGEQRHQNDQPSMALCAAQVPPPPARTCCRPLSCPSLPCLPHFPSHNRIHDVKCRLSDGTWKAKSKAKPLPDMVF